MCFRKMGRYSLLKLVILKKNNLSKDVGKREKNMSEGYFSIMGIFSNSSFRSRVKFSKIREKENISDFI